MKLIGVRSRLERLKVRFGRVTNLEMQYDYVKGYVNGHYVKITYLDGIPYKTRRRARQELRKAF